MECDIRNLTIILFRLLRALNSQSARNSRSARISQRAASESRMPAHRVKLFKSLGHLNFCNVCFRDRPAPRPVASPQGGSEPKLTSPLFGTIGRFRGKEGRFPILISVRNCLPVEERSHSICCFLHCLEFVVEVHMAELIKRQIFMLIRQLLDKLG